MNQSLHTLKIFSLNKDGIGVASWIRPGGIMRTVFVLYSLPNEEVVAHVYKYKSRLFARPESIETESPERIVPTCKHFGSCGGCMLQHMQVETQKKHKEHFINELFQECSASVLPLISSDVIWHYRNKMQWSFSQDVKGEKFLGLVKRHSKGKVQNITECHLVDPWMNEALSTARAWWNTTDLKAFHHYKNTGSLRTLTFRTSIASGDRVIILTVSANPDYALKKADLDSFVKACICHAPLQGKLVLILQIHQQIKGNPTQFFEMRLHGPDFFREQYEVMLYGKKVSLEMHVSPSSFLQPNSFLANTIYTKALEMAELKKTDVVFDLYAGVGIFGMLASFFVKEVVAIELNADACFDAQTNAKRLGIDNFQLFQGDVGALLKQKNFMSPNVVIVDPPRCGLGPKVVDELVALKPERIVYVSCNPETQAVDVQSLSQRGYSIRVIQPIDQFTHTAHVENIILLQRK